MLVVSWCGVFLCVFRFVQVCLYVSVCVWLSDRDMMKILDSFFQFSRKITYKEISLFFFVLKIIN